MGWSVFEGDSFAAGVVACGGPAVVDEIIAPIVLGLSRNPLKFPRTYIPGIGLAKTETHWRGSEIVMGYSVWFRVNEADRTVELLHIELTNPDWSYWDNDFDGQ